MRRFGQLLTWWRETSRPGPESTVGSGHHLHPDRFRIPLSGGGGGCLQPPGGGLGHEDSPENSAGTRCAGDGFVAETPTERGSIILTRALNTPRLPLASVAAELASGLPWDSVGDCLTMPCVRASLPRWSVSCWTATASQHRLRLVAPLRLYRGLLQPTSVTLITGLSLPG